MFSYLRHFSRDDFANDDGQHPHSAHRELIVQQSVALLPIRQGTRGRGVRGAAPDGHEAVLADERGPVVGVVPVVDGFNLQTA